MALKIGAISPVFQGKRAQTIVIKQEREKVQIEQAKMIAQYAVYEEDGTPKQKLPICIEGYMPFQILIGSPVLQKGQINEPVMNDETEGMQEVSGADEENQSGDELALASFFEEGFSD